MKQFKYSLAKKGKHKCPSCGKKTFVVYLDTESGVEMQGFGRCDRESSCAFHSRPDKDDVVFIQTAEVKEKQETNYIHLSTLERYYVNSKDCFLIDFLKTKFSILEIENARKMYLLSNKNNHTVFWQIDQLERVRSGKVMEYNPNTGKRVKDQEGKSKISWMHKKPFNLKQCLFGLHLTKEDKNKTIAIVESEKTAVIMSMFVPDFLWIATGSKSGFKIELLSAIKLRKIIAFPDKGCFEEWSDKAVLMNGFGFNIVISDLIENEDCLTGEDIADVYLRL